MLATRLSLAIFPNVSSSLPNSFLHSLSFKFRDTQCFQSWLVLWKHHFIWTTFHHYYFSFTGTTKTNSNSHNNISIRQVNLHLIKWNYMSVHTWPGQPFLIVLTENSIGSLPLPLPLNLTLPKLKSNILHRIGFTNNINPDLDCIELLGVVWLLGCGKSWKAFERRVDNILTIYQNKNITSSESSLLITKVYKYSYLNI